MTHRSLRLGGVLSALALLSSIVSATPRALAAPPRATVTYVIGLSLPYGSLKELATGIERGVRVAVKHANDTNAVPGVTFDVKALDDTVGQNYNGAKDANNGRQFIQNPMVIGEVGPLNSGAARVSMPVYNSAGLVQISPSNTAVDLTASRAKYEPTSNSTGSPITYFRTCTTDAFQGPGAALYAAKTLKIKSVYVTDNQDAYGIGLANAFKAEVAKLGVKVLGYGEIDVKNLSGSTQTLATAIAPLKPDMVYFGGEYGPGGGAEYLADAIKKAGSKASFMGGDGIYASDFIKGSANGGAYNALATSVGGDPTKDPNAQAYLKLFHAQYPNVPVEAYDTYSYDAAAILISGFGAAVKAGQIKVGDSLNKQSRLAIARMVAATKDFHGATGTTNFDKNGDSSNHVIGVYKVVGTQGDKATWKWIYTALAPQV